MNVSKPFPLKRYFLTASLIGMVVISAILVRVYRNLAENYLIAHEARASANLTHLFANVVWSQYRPFVTGSSGRTGMLPADASVQQALQADVLRYMRGLPVVKVKIYNLQGMTVFSTDARQVGEFKSGNEGFERAKKGQITSSITFRERFDAFEGVINNRDLIATYIPVSSTNGESVEAVFEVYSDVTDLLLAQSSALVTILLSVLGALGALYLFQYWIVRNASRAIHVYDKAQKRRREQVEHQALHDGLTGLPNRSAFKNRLAEALAHSERRGRSGALLFIDLDQFKQVNDTLGHAAGDELLQRIADRIKQCLRTGEVLFRLGGDEFTVILGDTQGPIEAAILAKRIVKVVAAPVDLMAGTVNVGASVGIALFPEEGASLEALLQQADAAMYRAKQAGRGTYVFSNPVHDAVATEFLRQC